MSTTMQQIYASNTMISNSLRASATMLRDSIKEPAPNDARQRMPTIAQMSDEKSSSDATRQSVRNQDFLTNSNLPSRQETIFEDHKIDESLKFRQAGDPDILLSKIRVLNMGSIDEKRGTLHLGDESQIAFEEAHSFVFDDAGDSMFVENNELLKGLLGKQEEVKLKPEIDTKVP